MRNKFFVLSLLSFIFRVQGMDPLPGIENFGCRKVGLDVFLQDFSAVIGQKTASDEEIEEQQPISDEEIEEQQLIQDEEIEEQQPRARMTYALNVLSMLDAERAAFISNAMGMRYVTVPEMISYLKYLGINSCSALETLINLRNIIDSKWFLIKGKIELQIDKWVNIKKMYKAEVRARLSPYLGENFRRIDAVNFFIAVREIARSMNCDYRDIGSARYVKRSHERVWQEIYDNWDTIKLFAPLYRPASGFHNEQRPAA